MIKPKSIITQFKFFFSFSKGERRGIIILLTLILLLIISKLFIIPVLSNSNKNFSSIDKELAKFEASIDTSSNSYKKNEKFDFNNSDRGFAEIKLNPFPFNPNVLLKEQWIQLGLSEKQANVIQNYLSKGGKFYKKEDLKKMFCISNEEYRILENYITIPDNQKSAHENFKYETKIKPIFIVDVNTADTNDLQEIKGIGASFARRIAKYRDLLGGFIKKEQLLEVFGMDSARYLQIQASFTINPSAIQKININKATIQELKKHPYFDYYTAKSVVMYRTQKGEYKTVSEIKKANLIYDDFYDKIYPYLTVN